MSDDDEDQSNKNNLDKIKQTSSDISKLILKRNQKGTIKFVNYQTHFGFITMGNDKDIYFRIDSLKGDNKNFQQDDCVFFDIRATGNDRSSKHKFEACNICMDEIGTAE